MFSRRMNVAPWLPLRGKKSSRSLSLERLDPRDMPATVLGDFNGDGFDDLAVGSPYEDFGTKSNAGAVNIIFGAPAGITTAGNRWIHQDTAGIAGTAGPGDRLGWALAAGDFNGDGFDDLAIGVPGEDVISKTDAGAVNILFGASTGLVVAGNLWLHQDSAGIEGTAGAGDEFGSALATGDFNGDGFDDLAVGVPKEDVGTKIDAGAVNIIFGAAAGLSIHGDRWLHQETAGIAGAANGGEEFGFSLAAGDLNGNGFDDLVIGVPKEDVGTKADAGAVNLLFGAAAGVTVSGNRLIHQDTPAIADAAEAGDLFGFSVAVGDLNGNGFDDVVIGVPKEDLGTKADAGAANLLFGDAAGVTTSGNRLIHQDTAGIMGTAAAGDQFAYAVAVGDLNNDGFSDLVVGAPFDDVGTKSDAGAVNVIFGAAAGVTIAGNAWIHQDTAGIPGTADAGDLFGASLTTGDLNGDGFDDMVVGVPLENIGAKVDAGAVNIIFGAAAGFKTTGGFWLHQDTAGILDTAEAGDQFGFAVG